MKLLQVIIRRIGSDGSEGVGGRFPSKYLRPAGRANVDMHKSGIRFLEKCDICGLSVFSSYSNGIHVDAESWDGSDFFSLEEVQGIYVSERVAAFVIDQQLTGSALTPTEYVAWPSGVSRPEDAFGK